MRVSIITATFNSEKYILSAIESINSQTYKDIEHIFMDGGSTDDTLNIIRRNSSRNPVIITEKDGGIYDALNKGISVSTGNIIGFVHSDDFLSSVSMINELINQFIKSKADGIYGDLQYVDKQHPNKIVRQWKSKDYTDKLLKSGWMPPHPTLFIKRNIYTKYGLFDISFKIAADYDFILRIFTKKKLKFVYIPRVITKMRIGGVSNRNIRNIVKKSREDYRALKKNRINNPVRALIVKNLTKIPQFFR